MTQMKLFATIDETCEATGHGRTRIYELIKDQKLESVVTAAAALCWSEASSVSSPPCALRRRRWRHGTEKTKPRR